MRPRRRTRGSPPDTSHAVNPQLLTIALVRVELGYVPSGRARTFAAVASAKPPETRPVSRPHRASTYLLLLVLFMSVAGTVYLWTQTTDSQDVYAAARDLPAYHRITEADVRRVRIQSSDVPGHPAVARDSLLGRYTLVAVSQDTLFDTSRLGPRLEPALFARAGVTGLEASGADVMNGRLARGDMVDVLLSPQSPKVARATRLRAAVILDVSRQSADANRYAVVLLISKGDETQLEQAGGSARAFFIRVASYQAP